MNEFLTRTKTLLQPQRGIATRGGLPVAVQVQFGGGLYPDRLLPDGSIEHIGEGLRRDQRPVRGNAAMLRAIEERTPFPVYEKIGKDRYRLLGKFVARSHAFKALDPVRKPDWNGYVFTLKPVWKPTEKISGWEHPPSIGGHAAPRQPDLELRLRIEQKAMEAVESYFISQNYEVRYVHKENLGWDLEATRANEVLHLEVKGRSTSSLTVELTPNEYDALKQKGTFRLCIVCEALTAPQVSVFTLTDDRSQMRAENGLALAINVHEGAILKALA